MEDRYLFRAKRMKYDPGVYETWVTGFYIHTNGGDYIVDPYKASTFSEGDLIEVVPETVCQCTGLRDRNGLLIYENDIVETKFHKGVIKCENFAWAIETTDDHVGTRPIFETGAYFDDIKYFKVVGNIFDNPELRELRVQQSMYLDATKRAEEFLARLQKTTELEENDMERD